MYKSILKYPWEKGKLILYAFSQEEIIEKYCKYVYYIRKLIKMKLSVLLLIDVLKITHVQEER